MQEVFYGRADGITNLNNQIQKGVPVIVDDVARRLR
jgi:hypothetical protein